MKASLGNPHGPIFDASEIREDSPEKAGPWFCSTKGCPVQFKYHRVASYAIDEPGRVVRNATFGHGSDRAHLLTCYLNERAIKQKLLADHRAVLTVEGDKLLLNWGDAPVPRQDLLDALCRDDRC